MKTALTTVIGIMFVIIVGMYCKIAHMSTFVAPDSPPAIITAPELAIMSIRELQTALNAQGHSRYKCEVDGKMGKETLKAWSNYICDRQAIKEFK